MIEEFDLDGQMGCMIELVPGWRCRTTGSSRRWRRVPAKMKDENRRNPLPGDLFPPSLWGKAILHERAVAVNSRHTSRQVHYTPIGTIRKPLGRITEFVGTCCKGGSLS